MKTIYNAVRKLNKFEKKQFKKISNGKSDFGLVINQIIFNETKDFVGNIVLFGKKEKEEKNYIEIVDKDFNVIATKEFIFVLENFIYTVETKDIIFKIAII